MITAASESATPTRTAPANAGAQGAGGPVPSLDLSVLIPALNEGPNLAILLPQVAAILRRHGVRFELLVLTRNADQATIEAARQNGARVVEQTQPGIRWCLDHRVSHRRGDYLLTMDADLSHPPEIVERLWLERDQADVTIASRYVPGGSADMGFYRYTLSRVLNALFSRGLDVPIRDLSSGFRLYRSARDSRAAHHQPRLRRAAADRRAGVRRGLARTRGAVPLSAARARQLASPASFASAWRACARSGSCGCCETRSSPPTMTIARTTAGSRCSATGSDRASAT